MITAVVLEGRSQADVSRAYGVSKGWVSKLVARYRTEGELAFEPRSRRPKTTPTAIVSTTVDLIIEVRRQLVTDGLRSCPVKGFPIHWYYFNAEDRLDVVRLLADAQDLPAILSPTDAP